ENLRHDEATSGQRKTHQNLSHCKYRKTQLSVIVIVKLATHIAVPASAKFSPRGPRSLRTSEMIPRKSPTEPRIVLNGGNQKITGLKKASPKEAPAMPLEIGETISGTGVV